MKTYADLKNEYHAKLAALWSAAHETAEMERQNFRTSVDALIAEAIAAGMSSADIADRLGIHGTKITDARRRLGIFTRKNPNRGQAEAMAKECAAKGMTQSETARHIGVTRERVRQIAARSRIAFPDGRRKGKTLVSK